MTETNIRYLQDNDGDRYYPMTHVDAIEGFDTERNKENDKALQLHEASLSNMVGDTGWVDFQVNKDNKKNYISSAAPCGIREVRVGNELIGKWFVIRSIRINIGNIKDGEIIAQLPQGFTDETVSFILRSSGGKTPIEFSIEKDNTVKAYLTSSDSNLWACGEHTWLV